MMKKFSPSNHAIRPWVGSIGLTSEIAMNVANAASKAATKNKLWKRIQLARVAWWLRVLITGLRYRERRNCHLAATVMLSGNTGLLRMCNTFQSVSIPSPLIFARSVFRFTPSRLAARTLFPLVTWSAREIRGRSTCSMTS